MTWLVLLAAVGATLVLVHGTIAAPIRRLWRALLCCPQCTGFWVGAAFAVGDQVLAEQIDPAGLCMHAVCMGFATSLTATLASISMYAAAGRKGPTQPDPCAPRETEHG